MKDLRVNILTIDWDNLFIKPKMVKGVPSADTL